MDGALERSLYWNPVAIGYLAQLLLAALLAGYLVVRTVRDWLGRRPCVPTALLALAIGAFVPGLLMTLFRAMAGAGWDGYAVAWIAPTDPRVLAMPWVRVFTGIAGLAFVQFAYRFPDPALSTARERLVALAVTGAIVLVDGAMAVKTDLGLLRGANWSRPDWLAALTALSMLWVGVLFVRQWRRAIGKAREAAPRWQAEQTRKGIGLRQLARTHYASREATAAGGFLLFVLLPLAHTLMLVVQVHGTVAALPTDLVIAWSIMIQLPGLTLVYVGYLPERSSFLFKLTVIGVLVVLTTVTAAAYFIAPGYAVEFDAPHRFAAGTAMQLQPDGRDGYVVLTHGGPAAPAGGNRIGKAGAAVPLPFAFPFYGKRHRIAHVGSDGSIGFARVPLPTDIHVAYGAQPAIYPLVVRGASQGTEVTVHADTDHLVVTRRDSCARAPACVATQTVLHRDGRIVLHILQMPPPAVPDATRPLEAQGLAVVTPGWRAGAGAEPRVPARAVIFDNRRAFLAFLDQLYARFVTFMIGAVLIVAAGLPLIYRWLLVRPLDRLLSGISRFEQGALDTQVAVTFHDEIGTLTSSFNTMARTQSELVNGLEATIAERVAAVVDVTARNAQLEERTRLSADLHDSVSQTLFSATMLSHDLVKRSHGQTTEQTRLLRGLEKLNRDALLEMRLLIADLRSGDEGAAPLGARIAAQARTFEERHGIPVAVEILGDAPLPMVVFAMFHRIHGECLANIARHAAASRVEITLEALPGQALLVTRDDGRGFDPDQVSGDHLGLQIMHERAQHIGATLEIDTAPGKGTTITLIWMAENGA